MSYAIVAIGYNRPIAIKRLLESICCSDFGNDKVDLIISIDKGENQSEIASIAREMNWIYGTKIVYLQETRLGLKEHVLKCGDYVEKYEAIIMLEDDLTVSHEFYNFAKNAIQFYKNDQRIAGISLYKHSINVEVSRPFEANNNGYDIFLLQFAQSWGQCWTKEMWNDFREWYSVNSKMVVYKNEIPKNILKWNENSWLKYFMKYIIDEDKYFVYPQVSLSTNHSDVGTHSELENNDYQVPLLEKSYGFRFAHFEKCVRYDAFFEREDILKQIPFVKERKVCLDLYGFKTLYNDADILISTSILPYFVENTFQLKYRPHEINCINPTDGKGVFVYDLHRKTQKCPVNNEIVIIRYDIKATNWKKTMRHFEYSFTNSLRIRTRKFWGIIAKKN